MLCITADIYSGRPNPSWILRDPEATAILQELAGNRGAVSALEAGPQGLGYRGMIVEFEEDHLTQEFDLPDAFRIASGASLAESKGIEIAERLIHGMLRSPSVGPSRSTLTPLEPGLQRLLMQQLRSFSAGRGTAAATLPGAPEAVRPAPSAAAVCWIETGQFNPGFWNASPYVSQNNCYNYASNRRTNTFAQPGRASGAMAGRPFTCDKVRMAAVRDGARVRGACAPDSEKPRWFIAMVVWPGPYGDYHWYRKQTEGFWGHKPGGTPARNVDNSNRVITDPATANRGPYTSFCGYFYAPKSMRVR